MAPKSTTAEVCYAPARSDAVPHDSYGKLIMCVCVSPEQKKPASTAGKAPASKAPAGKAPAKKAVKKAPAGGDDKKRKRKTRKETYSSYIYKVRADRGRLC